MGENQIRNPLLYPAELQGRFGVCSVKTSSYNISVFLRQTSLLRIMPSLFSMC